MRRHNRFLYLAALLGGALAAPAAEPAGLALRVGKVVQLDDRDAVVNNAVVLVRGERIEAVGPASEVKIPDGYRVLDFPDHWLIPGMVDPHDHAAAGTWSDLNDMVYQTNPGLDTRSVPRPNGPWIRKARTGGVTTLMMIPGSGTNISGFGTVVSTGGETPDEITVRTPGSLKIAQAGNPEWYFGGNGRSFMNWNTRQTLEKARSYHRAWKQYEDAVAAGDTTVPAPEFDPSWEGFRGLFQRTMPATVHTQIYQVVLTTVRMIAGEFEIWTVLDHSEFDAWKLAPLIDETHTWTVCGPRGYHFDRAARRMVGFAAGWWKNGLRKVGLNTDAPVLPQEELSYQGAIACWYGWLPYVALRGVTSTNAKAIGVYDKVGSVETGKQADLAVWTGDPLDPRSACLLTMVRGEIIYDGTKGLRRY